MIIKNTVFNIVIPKVERIRKKMITLEDELKSDFTPSNILPIPDDAPPEIPRVLISSLNGHTKIQVSLTTISMVTNYDGAHSKDWKLCEEYLQRHIDNVIHIAEALTESKEYVYAGLVINAKLEGIDVDATKFLEDKMLKLKSSKDVFDVNCKMTYVLEEKFYVNLTYNNSRSYQVDQMSGKIIAEVGNDVDVSVDVNDRYISNFESEYKSSNESIKEIIRITNGLVPDKVSEFLEKGEVGL